MSLDKAKRVLQTSLLLFVILCVSAFAQETASCRLELTPGWRAYVLDFAPNTESMDTLRGASENGRKLWVWRNGRFVSLTDTDTLGVGEGFYLNASVGKDALELSGKTGAEIELQKGWNLCSSSRASEGGFYWGLDLDNAAYVQIPAIVKNAAVWIYAATLTLDDASEQIVSGSTVTRTAGEKTGSTFKDWTVSGVSVPDITSRTISFVMPFQDVLLKMNYNINAYTLTVDGEPEQVNYGVIVSKTAPDKPGHTFAGWTVKGATIYDKDSQSIIFSMPANDVELTTNYTINSYNLTVNGVAEPREYGSKVTVTAADKMGYSFDKWSSDDIVLENPTSQTLSFTMPANDVALTPSYTINSYILTVDEVKTQVNYGTSVSETAPTKEGHTFQNWTITGLTGIDVSSNPLVFSMPANDVELTSNYVVNSYNLIVDGEKEQVLYGSAVTRSATDKEGKTFGGWWNIIGITGIENTKTLDFAMPANDVSLDSYYYDNGEYLVVNLETGESRTSTDSPDLTDDTCRTTELWLRKIPKGTFTMGSPTDEVGRESRSAKETQHQVMLSEDFYIGVFEMTQKQYELIYGSNPSSYTGDTRPVGKVSYNTIRGSSTGAGWPSSHDVDSTSFLGKLRSKTGLSFDLPTEAQWEYACRAGTTTALNTGKNLTSTTQDSAMDKAGRYNYNTSDGKGDYSSSYTKVGSYLPNNWGLYDMHGNVWEWCLDWYQSDLGSAAITDPVGATSGSYRMLRGGNWCNSAQRCRSAARGYDGPSNGYSDSLGFRVALLPNYHALSVNGGVSGN